MEKELIMNTQYIDYYLQKNNLSKKDFAKKCGITLNELNEIYKQSSNINLSVVIQVVQTLKIKSDTFLFRDRTYPKQVFLI